MKGFTFLQNLLLTRHVKLTYLYAGLSVFLLFSCKHHQMIIKTTPPQADVYLWSEETKTDVFLGKTPYTILPEALLINEPFFRLSVSKTGYISQHIVLPAKVSEEQTINLKLVGLMAKTQSEPLNGMAKELLILHSLITAKDTEKAETLIKDLEFRYQYISSFQTLKGNFWLLKGEKHLAKLSFMNALSLLGKSNTNEIKQQLQQMIDLLSQG